MSTCRHILRAPGTHVMGRGNNFSIKQMLLKDGFTEEQIQQLRREGKVLETIGGNQRYVKGGRELYVLVPAYFSQEQEKRVDRGYLVDLE